MDNRVLYERYRTIAYERANPGGLDDVARELDAAYGKLLPLSLDARVLDIGCGMGQFLYYLKSKGYRNLTGVELSPEQAEYCRDNVTEQVVLTEDVISFLNERPSYWDCVLMIDVIEHLHREDVIPILGAVRAAMKGGGVLLIETGNMASLTGAYLRHIDFTHECGFTENSLRQVLRAVGFTDLDVLALTPATYSWRSWLLAAARKLWESCLRFIYRLERGWDAAPRVLSKLIVARATK